MMVMAPWAIALGFAVVARWLELDQEEEGPRNQKSIEVCVGSCSAMWFSEDGVLRVYAEETEVSCYRLVIDCSSIPHSSIPGEVDGYPVRIRISPEDTPDQRAARAYARRASEMGYVLRPVKTLTGQISVLSSDPESGRTVVLVEGLSVSPELDRFANETAASEGVSVSKRTNLGSRVLGEYPATVVSFGPA